MGHHQHHDSLTASSAELDEEPEMEWPFGKVEAANRDDLRETAYELFFTACRSSPGFCGRNTLLYYGSASMRDGKERSPTTVGCGGKNGLDAVASSRIKRALGLKMLLKRTSPKWGLANSSSMGNGGRSRQVRAPMTTAELMRQQMRVSEQSDNRLGKTLMRILVGQMGRRAETIILPLELLRHLKQSEFNDPHEYHLWQKRQLRILEAGIIIHPSIPLDRSDHFAARLIEVIRSSDTKPIDTGKCSETMQTLCNCVVTLASRGPNGATDTCHWADGFPINLQFYVILLQSIFDIRDETVVIDEVDELIELMKKTWSTLGINKLLHNVCFTWVLFKQFVTTGQVEHDLLSAALSMLVEVANDAKRANREFIYVKILSSTLAIMQAWAEKQLLDYHESFLKGSDFGSNGLMESVLPLALSAAKIREEDASIIAGVLQERDKAVEDSAVNRVDYYIRSSVRNAFTKILDNGISNSMTLEEDEDASKTIIQLAKKTEDLAMKEKKLFSCILKRWHPIAAGVAAVTLHSCYGFVLKQYVDGILTLTKEVIQVLQISGKLERVLVQMVVEDSVELEDGGKAIVREMVPYEVDSVIIRLTKTWVDERLKRVKECLCGAKETETWNPKSKMEPYSQSAMEMMKLAQKTADDFFDISMRGISDDLVQDLADGLETLLLDYTSFVASCGSKQSYIPSFPVLTRCNQRSKILNLCRKASPCQSSADNSGKKGSTDDGHHPQPSMSRGTQRLFIRLNTLYYLLSHIHFLNKSFSLSPPSTHTNHLFHNSHHSLSTVFSSIQSAIQHVSEVSAFRLLFLDLHSVFYESLYVGDVVNARIDPMLLILKQDLTLMAAIVTDQAQAVAVKEVMKASFEAFLMVLLAGGMSRAFTWSDYNMVVEDFGSLKHFFCMWSEGLVVEEVAEKEAEVVQGVVTFMGQSTEQLVEAFTIVACEASEMGLTRGASHKVPMPPTTELWNQTDANTILRVLCYRNDSTANNFLKKTFQLPRRR